MVGPPRGCGEVGGHRKGGTGQRRNPGLEGAGGHRNGALRGGSVWRVLGPDEAGKPAVGAPWARAGAQRRCPGGRRSTLGPTCTPPGLKRGRHLTAARPSRLPVPQSGLQACSTRAAARSCAWTPEPGAPAGSVRRQDTRPPSPREAPQTDPTSHWVRTRPTASGLRDRGNTCLTSRGRPPLPLSAVPQGG